MQIRALLDRNRTCIKAYAKHSGTLTRDLRAQGNAKRERSTFSFDEGISLSRDMTRQIGEMAAALSREWKVERETARKFLKVNGTRSEDRAGTRTRRIRI